VGHQEVPDDADDVVAVEDVFEAVQAGDHVKYQADKKQGVEKLAPLMHGHENSPPFWVRLKRTGERGARLFQLTWRDIPPCSFSLLQILPLPCFKIGWDFDQDMDKCFCFVGFCSVLGAFFCIAGVLLRLLLMSFLPSNFPDYEKLIERATRKRKKYICGDTTKYITALFQTTWLACRYTD